MSTFLSELGGITAGVGAEGLAFAAGFAAGHALHPEATLIAQDSWHGAQLLRLDPATAAEAAAENYAHYDDMANEATYSGLDGTRFAYLYDVTLTAPGTGELLNMLRRGTINPGNFAHGLRKAKLEPMWDDALKQLAVQYIGLGDIATAIVRGAVPAPSWVPVAPPTTTDNVPRFPVTDIDPIKLAAKLGYDEDMLKIMTARSGLSLAPILATQALFRGALTHNDWLLAIAEGDLRTEWAETLREAARAIPSPGEYAELWLRGWLTQKEAEDGAARHGMKPPDTDLIYKLKGRPVSNKQLYIGLARGGTYPSTYNDIPEPFRKAAQESNVRPEWASVWYEDRYTLPSAFVVRALLSDGAIDETRGQTILEHEGWPPDLAQLVAQHYAAKAGGATVDPHVKKAQSSLFTESHKAYVKIGLSRPQVVPALTALAVPAAAQQEIFTLWDLEKQLAADVPPA